ncbi:hypothetical protein WJX72_004908 [[Myrmecia] bisecta]|uniref:(2Fe-2S) ferredoxin domain-containing protein n=1 Tax=[Myrmecia] bisecta TaxID=41462 RepID=A0AAW1PJZ0_9CHLO
MPRDTSASRQPSTTLFQVCQGKDCCKRGSAALLEHAEYALADTPVSVAACKCLGECKRGPNVGIKTSGQKKPIVYTGVQTDDVQRIAEAHIERQRSLSL